MRTIPHVIPSAYKRLANQPPASNDVDTGGYDVMIGGIGFRLATDTQFPYIRSTEPTTVRRFDTSAEVGEQTLAALPWVKSQSSFHAGAGQQNLEQPYSAFQYQQEQISHIRYDTSLGVDPWTPGVVSRLPDTHLVAIGHPVTSAVTAALGGIDYMIVGGSAGLFQLKWTSGADNAPTISAIDLTGAQFGGASNCNVTGLVTDGTNYYALIQQATAGTGGSKTLVVYGSVASTAAPTVGYLMTTTQMGTLGWSKERLMAGLNNSLYELAAGSTGGAALPTPKYTHPTPTWTWQAIAESPTAVLAAGSNGYQSTIHKLELDSTGAVPTLAGGAVAAQMPTGESVTALGGTEGSFLTIGTTKGIRVGTFDTYSGALTYGPISLVTNYPVTALTGRDRFVYVGYSNQQADGTTGLARLDLSLPVDSGGRLAWAPDLRPPTSAPTGKGVVISANVLPLSNRMCFISTDGLHIEGPGPGSDGLAWIRTSRIRYDTDEPKLFKTGRLHGSLNMGTITVTQIMPFGGTQNIGTFGYLSGTDDPGELGLASGLYPWIQMQYQLNGSTAVLNSWQVRAYPAPARQRVITLTVNCFRDESDRYGLDVTDPLLPRQRYAAVKQLESAGSEIRFVEFTNTGAVESLVVIDQVEYHSFSRPNIDDDFGGYITFKLRETVGN